MDLCLLSFYSINISFWFHTVNKIRLKVFFFSGVPVPERSTCLWPLHPARSSLQCFGMLLLRCLGTVPSQRIGIGNASKLPAKAAQNTHCIPREPRLRRVPQFNSKLAVRQSSNSSDSVGGHWKRMCAAPRQPLRLGRVDCQTTSSSNTFHRNQPSLRFLTDGLLDLRLEYSLVD